MSGGSYIGQVPDSNFNVGRAGHAMIGIALHHTWTTLEGAIAHFLDPNAQVSAHEIVGRDGVPTFMLRPTDTAFADGLYEANLDYYAIEFVQSPTDVGFTPEQYAYGHKRALELAAQFGWTVSASTMKPHSAFVATSCPGDLDIPLIIHGGAPVAEQTAVPYKPIPGVVYDTPTNDRSFIYWDSPAGQVEFIMGEIAPTGQVLRWTAARTINGQWLLQVEGVTFNGRQAALWDDAVDDSEQGKADGHPNALAPSDFVAGPPAPAPAPDPVPPPQPTPVPVPPTPPPAPVPAPTDLQPVLDAIKAVSDQVAALAKHLGEGTS